LLQAVATVPQSGNGDFAGPKSDCCVEAVTYGDVNAVPLPFGRHQTVSPTCKSVRPNATQCGFDRWRRTCGVGSRLAPLSPERLYPLPLGWRRSQLAPFVLGFSLAPRTPRGEGLECPSYHMQSSPRAPIPSSSSCAATLTGCGESSKPCCHSASVIAPY